NPFRGHHCQGQRFIEFVNGRIVVFMSTRFCPFCFPPCNDKMISLITVTFFLLPSSPRCNDVMIHKSRLLSLLSNSYSVPPYCASLTAPSSRRPCRPRALPEWRCASSRSLALRRANVFR